MLWVTPVEKNKRHYRKTTRVCVSPVKICQCTSDDIIIQSVLHPGQGFSTCSSVGNQLQTHTRGNYNRATNPLFCNQLSGGDHLFQKI